MPGDAWRAWPGPRRPTWPKPGGVGAALGALRFWRPVGIILVALGGGLVADRFGGVGAILLPLAVLQALAVAAALLIRGDRTGPAADAKRPSWPGGAAAGGGRGLRDPGAVGVRRRRWCCSTSRTPRRGSTWGCS